MGKENNKPENKKENKSQKLDWHIIDIPPKEKLSKIEKEYISHELYRIPYS